MKNSIPKKHATMKGITQFFMHIQLFNTKTKAVEPFTPCKEGHVGIYSCGPTVYHYAHIGNLRAYIFADILRRMFVSQGFTVNHIINITDVGHLVGDGNDGQDKLEKGAAREGKTAFDIAKFYTEAFLHDIKALNIPQETFTFPKATDHIKEQIELLQTLEAKGYTYTITDGVYFDTSKYPSYADFAHLDLKGLQSGARVEENTEKRNSSDFALWKFSPKEEQRHMEWESPWGKGFPGWHIECSAMSMKYLGQTFDIHTGGIDHIPVHHTNEIAQSECATGKPYANYWMHVNFLNDTTGKMSKSNDDFLTLTSLTEAGYNPLAYRYFLLMTSYRKEVTFSYEALHAASQAFTKLQAFMRENSQTKGEKLDEFYNEACVYASDDLRTPEILGLIWKMIKDETLPRQSVHATILAIDEILGLNLASCKQETLTIPEEVQNLVQQRKEAREAKDFTQSDILRDRIKELGYLVQDTKEGQTIAKL